MPPGKTLIPIVKDPRLPLPILSILFLSCSRDHMLLNSSNISLPPPLNRFFLNPRRIGPPHLILLLIVFVLCLFLPRLLLKWWIDPIKATEPCVSNLDQRREMQRCKFAIGVFEIMISPFALSDFHTCRDSQIARGRNGAVLRVQRIASFIRDEWEERVRIHRLDEC